MQSWVINAASDLGELTKCEHSHTLWAAKSCNGSLVWMWSKLPRIKQQSALLVSLLFFQRSDKSWMAWENDSLQLLCYSSNAALLPFMIVIFIHMKKSAGVDTYTRRSCKINFGEWKKASTISWAPQSLCLCAMLPACCLLQINSCHSLACLICCVAGIWDGYPLQLPSPPWNVWQYSKDTLSICI